MIDINDLINICSKAGKEILKIYKEADKKYMEIEYKSDNSPLTLADRKSHQIISSSLEKLYPDIPVLSEEGSEIPYNKRKTWDCFWLVDPIDGTKEFIKKNGEFTVNIALINKGIPVIGIVYAPILEKYWYGSEKGSFVLENNEIKKIKVNDSFESKVKVVASRSHSSPLLKDLLTFVGEHELVSMGSSLKICLIAEGSADIYPRLAPTMEWDTAAAHAVLKFANGSLIDLDTKSEMVYNRENLTNSHFIANSSINITPFLK